MDPLNRAEVVWNTGEFRREKRRWRCCLTATKHVLSRLIFASSWTSQYLTDLGNSKTKMELVVACIEWDNKLVPG
jgi:hypothetical protein